MKKSLLDMCNLISSTRIEYLKVLIANARLQPDKLDDAFEGMVDDTDAFLDGWFAVRKIKGRHKPKDKDPKDPDENN